MVAQASQLFENDGARFKIWREAPRLDGLRTAAIGAFSCDTALTGSMALKQAIDLLRSEGFGAVVGPMNGDTWSDYRFVIESDGSPPFFMEPHNPPFFPKAFEEAGFSIVARYASARRAADQPVNVDAAHLNFRPLRLDDYQDELLRLHRLSLECFAGNAFYAPISAKAFLTKYLPLKPHIDPDLVLLVDGPQGELDAFIFGICDFAAQNPHTTVIAKTWASRVRGSGMPLMKALYERAQSQGAQTVINALFWESGTSSMLNAREGGEIFRRYALWGRRL